MNFSYIYQSESHSYLVSTESHIAWHPQFKSENEPHSEQLECVSWAPGLFLYPPLKLKVYLVNDKVKTPYPCLSEASVRQTCIALCLEWSKLGLKKAEQLLKGLPSFRASCATQLRGDGTRLDKVAFALSKTGPGKSVPLHDEATRHSLDLFKASLSAISLVTRVANYVAKGANFPSSSVPFWFRPGCRDRSLNPWCTNDVVTHL